MERTTRPSNRNQILVNSRCNYQLLQIANALIDKSKQKNLDSRSSVRMTANKEAAPKLPGWRQSGTYLVLPRSRTAR
jgi:hypothetical protein